LFRARLAFLLVTLVSFAVVATPTASLAGKTATGKRLDAGGF